MADDPIIIEVHEHNPEPIVLEVYEGIPGPQGDTGPQGEPGISTLWDGGPDVAALSSAADLRAAIEVLTEEELEEIFAPTVHTHAISDVTGLQTALDGKAATAHTHAISDVTNLQTALDARPVASGTRTSGALTRYDADGQLVPSGLVDNGTILSAASRSVAIGGSTAARQLEVRDATAAQQRWSYSDTHYGERQVDANGMMIDSSTGLAYRWMGWGSSRFVTLANAGNLWALYSNSGNGLRVGISGATLIEFSTSEFGLRTGATNLLAANSSLVSVYRPLYLPNRADPATPTDGGVVWVDSSGNLKFKSQAGTVTTLGVV